jgi:hypothetical protein
VGPRYPIPFELENPDHPRAGVGRPAAVLHERVRGGDRQQPGRPPRVLRFTRDDERVLYHAGLEDAKAWLDRGQDPPAMESAGPREMLSFDPWRLACGIVTSWAATRGSSRPSPSLVDSQMNFCLVPEVPFTLERFLSVLEQRIERRGHAVIVVAEGAGQDLIAPTQGRDASGSDIGVFLRDKVKEHFERIGVAISLKYIDPSHSIRSVPASAHDSAFCLLLGHCAVHAGMSGRTNMVVAFWNSQLTHVPISLAVSERKKIDPEGPLWSVVLASTGQPRDMYGSVRAGGR